MNRERRKELSKAIDLLNEAREKIEAANEIVVEAKDEEDDAYNNLPEGVQESEKGEVMEENASQLEDVEYELDSVLDTIDDQTNAIQEVIDR